MCMAQMSDTYEEEATSTEHYMESTVQFLTVAEASQALGITQGGVRDRIRRGSLAAKRVRGRYLVAAGDLLASAGVSRALANYLCQFLAVRISEQLAESFEARAMKVIEERLDRALAREAEANRELGEWRARAEFAEQWAKRMQQELDGYKALHNIRVTPGMTITLRNGDVIGTAEDDAPDR